MKTLVIIPARSASTRFPGKPLALLGGRTIIERVWEAVGQTPGVDRVVVATDDERILDAVTLFGGKAEMTRPDHKSGTDRIEEAVEKIGTNADVIINIQGDEPFIHGEQLEALKRCFDAPDTQIATLVKPFEPADGLERLENPNSPKVVVSPAMRALYFSRSVIPYLRNCPKE